MNLDRNLAREFSKKIACEFYRYNNPDVTNLEQAFDDWWNINHNSNQNSEVLSC